MLRAGVLALAVIGGPAGCADATFGPFGSGALPGDEGGPIRRATGENLEWPHLSSVPPRPTGYSTPAERQALLDRLRADLEAGRRELESAPVAR